MVPLQSLHDGRGMRWFGGSPDSLDTGQGPPRGITGRCSGWRAKNAHTESVRLGVGVGGEAARGAVAPPPVHEPSNSTPATARRAIRQDEPLGAVGRFCALPSRLGIQVVVLSSTFTGGARSWEVFTEDTQTRLVDEW